MGFNNMYKQTYCFLYDSRTSHVICELYHKIYRKNIHLKFHFNHVIKDNQHEETDLRTYEETKNLVLPICRFFEYSLFYDLCFDIIIVNKSLHSKKFQTSINVNVAVTYIKCLKQSMCNNMIQLK